MDIVASGTAIDQVAVTVSQAIRVQGVTCEVQQLLGEGTIRCVAMEGTEGLRRGEQADVLGLAYRCSGGTSYAWSDFPNVLGVPVDGAGDVTTELRHSIHRPSPAYVDSSSLRAAWADHNLDGLVK